MTTPPEMIPLPDKADYFRAAEIADIEAEAYGGINRYLFHKERAFRDDSQGVARLVTKIRQLGRSMEPLEEGSNKLADPLALTSVAVRLGAVGALVIVEKFHRRILYTRNVLDHLPQDMGSSDPQTLRKQIKEMGEEGLDILGDQTVHLAEGWQDAVTDDRDKQKLFLHTMGVVALGARNAHIAYNSSVDKSSAQVAFEQDLAKFEQNSPDIDAQIAAFFDSNH